MASASAWTGKGRAMDYIMVPIQIHLIAGESDHLEKAKTLTDEALELFRCPSGLFGASVRLEVRNGELEIESYPYFNNHTGVQKLVYAMLQLHILAIGGPDALVEHMY